MAKHRTAGKKKRLDPVWIQIPSRAPPNRPADPQHPQSRTPSPDTSSLLSVKESATQVPKHESGEDGVLTSPSLRPSISTSAVKKPTSNSRPESNAPEKPGVREDLGQSTGVKSPSLRHPDVRHTRQKLPSQLEREPAFGRELGLIMENLRRYHGLSQEKNWDTKRQIPDTGYYHNPLAGHSTPSYHRPPLPANRVPQDPQSKGPRDPGISHAPGKTNTTHTLPPTPGHWNRPQDHPYYFTGYPAMIIRGSNPAPPATIPISPPVQVTPGALASGTGQGATPTPTPTPNTSCLSGLSMTSALAALRNKTPVGLSKLLRLETSLAQDARDPQLVMLLEAIKGAVTELVGEIQKENERDAKQGIFYPTPLPFLYTVIR